MSETAKQGWSVSCRDAMDRESGLRVLAVPDRILIVAPPAGSSTLTINEVNQLSAALLHACHDAMRLRAASPVNSGE
jgi:hypothetical protein